MLASDSRTSLMDDLDFVAELEKFDSGPVAGTAPPEASSDAFEDLGDVWESAGTSPDSQPKGEPQRTFQDPEPELEPEGDYDAPPVIEERHTLLHVAGFLLMMALGGAAAVLVFHERVALLLR